MKTTLFINHKFDTAIYYVNQNGIYRQQKKDKEFILNNQNYNAGTALKVLVENNAFCIDYSSTSKTTCHICPMGNEKNRINGFYSTNSIKRFAQQIELQRDHFV